MSDDPNREPIRLPSGLQGSTHLIFRCRDADCGVKLYRLAQPGQSINDLVADGACPSCHQPMEMVTGAPGEHIEVS